MLQRFYVGDIALEELSNVNFTINQFKQSFSLESANVFLDTLRNYIKKEDIIY